jgi:tetratricopeptide (TPR) repeat protein
MIASLDSSDLLQQAVAAHNAGQLDLALQLYQQLLAQHSADPQVLTLLATLLQQHGHIERALRTFHLALELDPQYPDAYNNLACLLREQGQLDDALLCLNAACSLRPEYVDAHNNRAAVLCDLDRPDEALQAVEQALALLPESLAGHFNRGNALKELGHLADAANEYRWCLQQSPEFAKAEGNLAIVELMLGDYPRGLARYEGRWRNFDGGAGLHRFPDVSQWQSQALDSPLLIWTEQGLGDSLQMARFLAEAAERSGHRLLVQCHAPLQRLLQQNFAAIADVYVIGEPLPAFSWQCPMMSLPHVLGKSLQDLPGSWPYLHASAPSVAAGKRRIGLCWQSGVHGSDNREQRRKSLPLAVLEGLQQSGDIEFVCLQKDIEVSRWMTADIQACRDLADTADLINSLDLVLSVDTAVAHLAGALGKPVWLMLKFDGGNFWLDGRSDSPWYPSMRIFRQPAPGDWPAVIAAIGSELARAG